jgi:thiamine-phosphate diphosphorylase
VIPSLHLITSDRILADPGFTAGARRAIAAGGSALVLHLRTRTTPVRRLLALSEDLLGACREAGGRLALNDRLDVALAVGTGWGHLGSASIPVAVARRIMGDDVVIGTSVHSAAEAQEASTDADYLIAGNVFETGSHPGHPGRGLDFLREVHTCSPVSVVAIGGVTPERVGDVVSAGAAGVAVSSGVWLSGDPGQAVTRYLQSLREAGRPALFPTTRTRSRQDD